MPGKKLTKAEIVESVFNQVDELNKKTIQVVMDLVLEQIKQGIKEDKIIELRGFGTFEIKLRKGRKEVRNPKTGDIFPGKSHGVVSFRPGQELKKIAWPMRK